MLLLSGLNHTSNTIHKCKTVPNIAPRARRQGLGISTATTTRREGAYSPMHTCKAGRGRPLFLCLGIREAFPQILPQAPPHSLISLRTPQLLVYDASLHRIATFCGSPQQSRASPPLANMTATSPSGPPKRPKALLFDIGGVCVSISTSLASRSHGGELHGCFEPPFPRTKRL